jgi:dGTPase
LAQIAIWRDAFAEATRGTETRNLHAVRRPVLDAILNRLLTDVIQSEPGAQATGGISMRFSAVCENTLHELETFLLDRVYHHPDVARADAEGRQKIHELFSVYMRNPDLLPTRFTERIATQGPHRVICDYIAGMTDSYCISQHSCHCQYRDC